jgi:hypothetical protein
VFYIIAILIGVALGQQIKVTVSPELVHMARTVWDWLKDKAQLIQAQLTAVTAPPPLKEEAIAHPKGKKAGPVTGEG